MDCCQLPDCFSETPNLLLTPHPVLVRVDCCQLPDCFAAGSGWVFDHSKREEVLKALEVAGIEVSQNETAEKEPEPEPSNDANASLTIEAYKKAFLIKGDTKEVKDQLKALKCSWNGTLGGWVLPGSKKKEVVELLRADPTNVVEEVEPSAPPAKKAKVDKDFIDDDDDE